MGRGSNNQAVSASNLLYGTRARGSGPQEAPLYPGCIPNNFSELAWPNYVSASADLFAALGLTKSLSFDQRRELLQTRDPYCNVVHLYVERNDGKYLYLSPSSQDGKTIVGTYLANQSIEGLLVEAGPRASDSLDKIEQRLCRALADHKVDYYESTFDGQEVLARLTVDAPIDVTGPERSSSDPRDWARQEARDMALIAVHEGYISGAEREELIRLINETDGNILKRLAEEEAGAAMIGASQDINCRIFLGE